VIFAAVRLTACFSKLARSLKFSFKSKAISSGHFICQYNHVVKCRPVVCSRHSAGNRLSCKAYDEMLAVPGRGDCPNCVKAPVNCLRANQDITDLLKKLFKGGLICCQ
jgi:hypothetical protein